MSFDRTIAIDSIAEATASHGVEVLDELKVDEINSVSAAGITVNDDMLILGDLTLGALPSTRKTFTVHQDIDVTRKVVSPNLIVGIKRTITYLDLTAAGTTQTITYASLPGGVWLPVRAYAQVNTLFVSSGTFSAFAWTVGWDSGATHTSDPDGLLLTGDSDGLIAGLYQCEDSHKGVALDGTKDFVLQSDNQLTVSLTSAGANLDTATAGSLSIVVFYAKDPTAE